MNNPPYEMTMNKIELSATIQLRDRSFDDFTKYPIDLWEWFMDYIDGRKYFVIAMPTNNTENIKYQLISKRWRKPKSIL